MATTKTTTEELYRRIDARLRLRGQRLYSAANGELHVINRFRQEIAQPNVNCGSLALELGALKPDEEFSISDLPQYIPSSSR